MNKSSVIVLLLLLMLSCQKDSLLTPDHLTDEAGVEERMLQGDDLKAKKPNKVTICHRRGNGTFKAITVSENALPAHLGHGDYLPDADGDGFSAIGACTGSADDCDDTDPNVNPGAEEVCGDGIDNNCDGQVDEGCCPCFTYQEVFDVATASPNVLFADEEINDCLPLDISTFFFDPSGPTIIGTEAQNELRLCRVGPAVTAISEEDFITCTALVRQVQVEVQAALFCTNPVDPLIMPSLMSAKKANLVFETLLKPEIRQ
jgi:hypothetical protein